MKIQYARERFRRWLHPTLAVPVIPDPPERFELAEVPPAERLAAICGYRTGGVLVVVSARGTHCPVLAPSDWTVLEVANLLARIDELPEVEPGSRRA